MKPSWVIGLLALFCLFIGLSCKGCGNGGGGGTFNPPTATPVLTATAISSSEIDLSWTYTGVDQLGFLVERDSGSGFLQIVNLQGAGVSVYHDLGLLPSSSPPAAATSYSYRVRAYNFGGSGPYSNVAVASTKPLKWTQLLPNMAAAGFPTQRIYPGTVFDNPNNVLVLWGGDDGSGTINETWDTSLATPAWNQLLPASAGPPPPPTARANHTTIFDPLNSRMIMYGGSLSDPGVWFLNLPMPVSGATWSALPITGTPPVPRQGHTAVYDGPNQRMIIFGGFTSAGAVSEVWALNLPTGVGASWTQLQPNVQSGAPAPRTLHTAVYDSLNQRMVVFGGITTTVTNELWQLTLPVGGTPSWSPLGAQGVTPSPRSSLGSIYDSVGRRMLLFGGDNLATSNNILGETWVLSLSGTPTWKMLTLSPQAPARSSYAAAYDSLLSRMIIFGGFDSTAPPTGPLPLNDLWALGD